jgi:outer membrane protein assembly factor BamB
LEEGIVKLPLVVLLLLSPQATKSSEKPLEWNQFRGAKRDGHSTEIGLLKQWPAGGPPLAWKATGIGQGYSSVCVAGTRVFTTGEENNKSFLVALNVADGKLLWKLPIGGGHNDQQSGTGPRSTPATDGTVVVAVAPTGEIVCAAAATGRVAWTANMNGLGGSKPSFGFCESPYIDGNVVILSPGGQVVALSKANGKLAWKSKKLKGDTDYSSVGVAELGKVRQYLVMTGKSVAGILPSNGSVIWEGDYKGEEQNRPMVPTPVFSNGMVFIAAGYGVGCKGFKLALAGNAIRVQEAYEGTQFQIHHGGMVAVGEHVYGLHDQGTLKCIEIATGKEVWVDRSVGKGSIAYADGQLYCRGEGGGVALVEASPAAYKENGRLTPPDRNGNRSWAYPAISGGKLYLREGDVLLAYDVKMK